MLQMHNNKTERDKHHCCFGSRNELPSLSAATPAIYDNKQIRVFYYSAFILELRIWAGSGSET